MGYGAGYGGGPYHGGGGGGARNVQRAPIYTLQGTNISHLGKRKIIFKMPFLEDMLVPWRVFIYIYLPSDNSPQILLYLHIHHHPWVRKLRLFVPQVLHHMVLRPPQRRSCPPCNLFRVPVFVCCFLWYWYCTPFVCERGREVCQNIKQHQLHYHLCFFWLHLDQLSSYIHTHPLQSTDHPLPRVFCAILLAVNHQKSIGYRIFKRLQKENQ